jgi:hypothetical protein
MYKHHHVQEESTLKWVIKHELDSTPYLDVYAVAESSETPRRVHPQLIEYVSNSEIHLHFSSLKKGFAFLT